MLLFVCPRTIILITCKERTGTDTLQPKPHTGRFKTGVYVADTKGGRKTRKRTQETFQRIEMKCTQENLTSNVSGAFTHCAVKF